MNPDVMKAHGHRDPKMSMSYNREVLEQSSRVAKLRQARRSENKD